MSTNGKQLTTKQAQFVAEYLIDLNATQAAIRAGYSEKTAESQGSRLLSNAKVAAAVAKAQEERAERTEVTQDMVVEGLLKIAQTPLWAVAARVSAWGLLGKHLGMFTDRVHMSGSLEVMSIDAIDAEIARLSSEHAERSELDKAATA